MIVADAVILNKVLSLKTHVCIGGQNNSGSTWLEAVAARSVLLGFISLCTIWPDKNGSGSSDH